MKKRTSFYTISYIVYPPNYDPWGGDMYTCAKSLSDARKLCLKKGFGVGTTVTRQLHKSNNHGHEAWWLGGRGRRIDEWGI